MSEIPCWNYADESLSDHLNDEQRQSLLGVMNAVSLTDVDFAVAQLYPRKGQIELEFLPSPQHQYGTEDSDYVIFAAVRVANPMWGEPGAWRTVHTLAGEVRSGHSKAKIQEARDKVIAAEAELGRAKAAFERMGGVTDGQA